MDDYASYAFSQPMYQNTSKGVLHEHGKNLLARNLKRLRKSLGLSQEELGHRIDADQAYISRIETSNLNPTLESLTELAHALDGKLSDLFKL